MSEHAVIVYFKYDSPDLKPIFTLEQELEKAIAIHDAGEYDGNEIALDGSDCVLYMYGPNADRLFEVIMSHLESVPFMLNAKVLKRYGPPETGVPENVVTLRAK